MLLIPRLISSALQMFVSFIITSHFGDWVVTSMFQFLCNNQIQLSLFSINSNSNSLKGGSGQLDPRVVSAFSTTGLLTNCYFCGKTLDRGEFLNIFDNNIVTEILILAAVVALVVIVGSVNVVTLVKSRNCTETQMIEDGGVFLCTLYAGASLY